MITAGNLIDNAAKLLQDETNVRWLRIELMTWLNAAQREIVIYKPDASSVAQAVPLVAGTLQTLPSTGIKVLDVTRNMGASGSTPGRAITLIDRHILDRGNSNWHASTANLEILHYMTDWRTPAKFYVFPPAAVPTQVEVVFSVMPADCVGEQSPLSINEIYANPALNYMMFRANSKDAEYASPAQATAYYQLFSSEVGIKTAADQTSGPK